jgi:hypothetical protein
MTDNSSFGAVGQEAMGTGRATVPGASADSTIGAETSALSQMECSCPYPNPRPGDEHRACPIHGDLDGYERLRFDEVWAGFDGFKASDVVEDSDDVRWGIIDADGGVVTVRGPDGSVSRMQSSVMFWRGRFLLREASDRGRSGGWQRSEP